jgi:outer membrane protein
LITRVEHAYWELVHALKNLQVQTEAVKQTRAQVETNKRQVAQGVLAPIDVVEAEAQVKIFEQNVYAAQEEVTKTENALMTLMLADRSAAIWSRALLPITPVNLEAPRMLLAEAINTALENRFELAELRTSKDINEINKRFYRDRTKPQVDLQVSYSSNGYAGTLTDNDNPIGYAGWLRTCVVEHVGPGQSDGARRHAHITAAEEPHCESAVGGVAG